MTPKFTNFKWSTFSDSTSEPYRMRGAKALEYIEWAALCKLATDARDVPCVIGDQYGFGGRHVVREIVFDDGEHWIARVGIPAVNFSREENYVPAPLSHSWSTTKAKMMQSEIDTMSFLREHTDIPVPRVFTFDTTAMNTVRAPYMFIECVQGTCAVDMPGCRGDIPEPYKTNFFASEASVLVRLWNVKFDKIGCIFKNPDTGHYEIGPLPNGLGGPYSTATEYYRAWAVANMSKPGATSDFPSRIETIASMISKNDNGPFRLIHPDFGHNNIIVDDDFNMLSVIDWEYSFVGPPELAARFPLRLQMYPEAILPQSRDANGRITDEDWHKMSENREHWVNQAALQESSSCDVPRLSGSMFGVQADILFMIRMWEERMPWMYTYQGGVKEGLDMIQQRLRQAKERT